ncbi:MAG: hypothetical protein H6735_32995 [Alphaproteobacteria bacterium]|nr:hypothetical protein [Alphaproteobacteria bacterium]
MRSVGEDVLVDLYSGFEGEREIVFSSSQGTIRAWCGYFDELMRHVQPGRHGWEGFARHYHLLTGWIERPSWTDPNPEDTLRQLETVAPLDGEAETFRRELVRLYASSIAAGAALSIREE